MTETQRAACERHTYIQAHMQRLRIRLDDERLDVRQDARRMLRDVAFAAKVAKDEAFFALNPQALAA